ncbi:MAG TPA: hypothetical protein VFU22_15860, partial [Roseiflexaceae bacterium]|nr:hypothetical protein [Roseiflexaceae bacterium]
DTTYGTVENIVAIEDAGIRAYMPLPDFEQRTLFFGKHRFTGAALARRKAKYTEQVIVYQADATSCNTCALKAKCTESDQGRMVNRHFDEAYLDLVRSYHSTEAYKKAMRSARSGLNHCLEKRKTGTEWNGSDCGCSTR